MAQPTAQQSTLQDRVYLGVSNDIMTGALLPGEKLRVTHLANRFGTSQAPVREALRRLTEEGLAHTVPYVGAVVRSPTWAEIQDIYAVRIELETYAVRRILAKYPRVRFAPARRALRELERAVKTGDEVQVIDADLGLHRQICELAGSELTLELWETIVKRFRGARLSLLRAHPDDLDTVVPNHEVLINALESGDVNIAQAAFRDHLLSAVVTWAKRTGNTLDD